MYRVVLCFDDGMLTVKRWWLRYRKPVTIFICPGVTELASNNPERMVEWTYGNVTFRSVAGTFLTWNDLKELIDQGCEVGCHTYNHRRIDDRSEAVVRRDLSSSKKLVIKNLGVDPKLFAFPWHLPGHEGLVHRYHPLVRTPHSSGRVLCGNLQVFIGHCGMDDYLQRITRELLNQGAIFELMSKQDPAGPLFW